MSALSAAAAGACLAPAQAGRRLAGLLAGGALLASVALVPLLPPVALKARATLALGALALGALYLWARTGTRRTSLDGPVLLYLGAAALATLAAPDPLVSFYPSRFRGEGLAVLLALGALTLAGARLGPRAGWWMMVATVTGAVMIGVVAVLEFYGLDPLPAWGLRRSPAGLFDGRAYVTMGNPIFLGAHMVLALPLALAAGLDRPRRTWALTLLAAGVLFAGLVASQTRGAWVGLVVALLVLAGLARGRPTVGEQPGRTVGRQGRAASASRPSRRVVQAAVLFAAVAALMGLTRPQAALGGRVASTADLSTPSLQIRLYLWRHTLPLVAERPLLGWGFSALVGRFPDYGSPTYRRLFGERLHLIDSPHNELLHVALSTGLVGLAAYLWAWVRAARGLWGRWRRGGDRLAAGCLAGLGGYAVWLQSGWSLLGPMNLAWAILALGAATAPADGATGVSPRPDPVGSAGAAGQGPRVPR
ncbi:MAG: O-antigen ligase family protein [Armatimonadota bacterium]|nr:O-antigen ligase family protein [Armatimonadota bacterium]MDR7460291.1 O-antigen ligase family protein [Armatimonadota bacterium]MDR7480765.1 O-antigen ligase family protein [Armatimonadota bacterium]MDR7488941.1 O-antigen ligase family protein [Armatimonadota bacterium]MDR7492145.1 O-antigen ligase family protein [Armatimonadota bacterium]